MNLETNISQLWREYCRLYPEDLRQWMQAEMARLVAHRDDEMLAGLTSSGLDCGDHAQVLEGMREIVRRYWRAIP